MRQKFSACDRNSARRRIGAVNALKIIVHVKRNAVGVVAGEIFRKIVLIFICQQKDFATQIVFEERRASKCRQFKPRSVALNIPQHEKYRAALSFELALELVND